MPTAATPHTAAEGPRPRGMVHDGNALLGTSHSQGARMIETSSPSLSEKTSESRYDQSFLSTLRAVAPCAREFARLSASLADSIAESLGGMVHEKIVVRQSPERCIIQV